MAQQLQEANTKYETEKRIAQINEQQLELSRQKNVRDRILLGGILLLIIGVVLSQGLSMVDSPNIQ